MLASQEDEAVPPRTEHTSSFLLREENEPSKCCTPGSSSPTASQEQDTDGDATTATKDAEKHAVPPGMVCLTFLPLTGARHAVDLDPSWQVLQVKKYLLEHWPQEWTAHLPPSTKHVDLILSGCLLEENKQLLDYKLRAGEERIVHLVIRPDYVKAENNRDVGVCRRCKYCCIIL